MGFAASVPYPPTSPGALPVSSNDQAFFSVETLESVIVDPAASRVFDKSAFEYGHVPVVDELPAASADCAPNGTPIRLSASANTTARDILIVNLEIISPPRTSFDTAQHSAQPTSVVHR